MSESDELSIRRWQKDLLKVIDGTWPKNFRILNMDWNAQLMPCPFCGRFQFLDLLTDEHVWLEYGSSVPNIPRQYHVICSARTKDSGCGASSGFHLSPGAAVEFWNRRAIV